MHDRNLWEGLGPPRLLPASMAMAASKKAFYTTKVWPGMVQNQYLDHKLVSPVSSITQNSDYNRIHHKQSL
jgi:hypothetical protein